MNIAILGLNYDPEPVGVGPYTAVMARTLAANGNTVFVVCAQPYYPQWRPHRGYRPATYRLTHESGVSVLRCPIYIPRDPTGTRRLLHYSSFLAAAAVPLLGYSLVTRPHVIIAIAPSIAAAPLASIAAKLCGGTSWLHVQDLE